MLKSKGNKRLNSKGKNSLTVLQYCNATRVCFVQSFNWYLRTSPILTNLLAAGAHHIHLLYIKHHTLTNSCIKMHMYQMYIYLSICTHNNHTLTFSHNQFCMAALKTSHMKEDPRSHPLFNLYLYNRGFSYSIIRLIRIIRLMQ